MNLLAITRHADLVERLRTAFEGAGHRVFQVPDPLEALAGEAWERAQLILVDAVGDPMDGLRFCHLLRGESRALFQGLPIVVVFPEAPLPEDLDRLAEAGADGHLVASDGLQRILTLLGPMVEGAAGRVLGPGVPIVAAGLRAQLSKRISSVLTHFGFELKTASLRGLDAALTDHRAQIVLLGLDPAGTRALEALRQLQALEPRPYPILVGRLPGEALQRRLLLSGAMDWLHLPLSAPRLLHACNRGLAWLHARRVQQEFQFQLNDLRERRVMLEMEAAALRNEVLTDPLTDLLNRRAFNQNLENAFNQWSRHRRPFVLILGDLDYFKLINDRFGHLVGDEVLKGLAQRIRSSVRRSDLGFRIGGEEFALILNETILQAGTEVAEKLRHRIDATPFVLGSGQPLFPTMSFGVACPEGHTLESMFAAADEALYVAKRKGRNRVEVAPVPGSGTVSAAG